MIYVSIQIYQPPNFYLRNVNSTTKLLLKTTYGYVHQWFSLFLVDFSFEFSSKLMNFPPNWWYQFTCEYNLTMLRFLSLFFYTKFWFPILCFTLFIVITKKTLLNFLTGQIPSKNSRFNSFSCHYASHDFPSTSPILYIIHEFSI